MLGRREFVLRRWRIAAIMLLISGGLIFGGPALLGRIYANLGMVRLSKALAASDRSIDGYPAYAVLDQANAQAAIDWFRQAIRLDDGNTVIRWGLGRAAMASGDTATATAALDPLEVNATRHPLLYLDRLAALSYAGKREQVIRQILSSTLPYQSLPLPSRMIIDSATLAYLEQGRPNDWMNARALRPADLYANYMLWKQASLSNDLAGANVYSQALTQFHLESIHPVDERILDYAAPVIADLLNDQVWDRDKARNVVAFLVWQHPHSTGVERLLKDLSARYPQEADWAFYLAELYQRRGNFAQSEDLYRRALAIDSDYSMAIFRLALVSELQGHLTAAADRYAQYLARVPHDWLSLKRLADIYHRLGDAKAAAASQELATLTDMQRAAAEQLGLSTEQIELGPNLIQNGNFDVWTNGSPAGWRLGQYLGQTGDQGLYFAGEDDLIPGEKSARIIALWGGPLPDGTATFAEYIGSKLKLPEAQYLILIHYSSHYANDGGGLLYVGDYANAARNRSVMNQGLPDSHQQWRTLVTIVNGSLSAALVDPLVRTWGYGDQQVRLVEVRPVWMKGSLR
jgi:tetratricopeptide (TPR) repeat protein